MKLTNTILVLALACGTGWAQNGPVIIQGAKATADAAQQKQNSNVKAVSVAASPAATKPAVAKASTPAVKPAAVSASKTPATKPSVQPVKPAASQPATKPTAASAAKVAAPTQPKAVAAKPDVKAVAKPVVGKPAVVKTVPVAVKPVAVKAVAAPVAKKSPAKEAPKAADNKPAVKGGSDANVSVEKAPEPAKNEKPKTYSANGRRDPFISPVVSQSAVGSGCSTGKRCLAVEQISLKGVVKSETGMIAVVVNALDKAYFLRENDPVFDGYVVKITTDSIVFKETVQDKLGKPFTKEVTKKLNTPAV